MLNMEGGDGITLSINIITPTHLLARYYVEMSINLFAECTAVACNGVNMVLKPILLGVFVSSNKYRVNCEICKWSLV